MPIGQSSGDAAEAFEIFAVSRDQLQAADSDGDVKAVDGIEGGIGREAAEGNEVIDPGGDLRADFGHSLLGDAETEGQVGLAAFFADDLVIKLQVSA